MDGSTMRLDDLLRDPEADTEPTIVKFRCAALERPEDPGLVLGRDADALIAHGQYGGSPLTRHPDGDGSSAPILERVRQEIRGDLFDVSAVPRTIGALDRELDGTTRLLRGGLESRRHLTHDGTEIEALECQLQTAGMELGHLEQTFGEISEIASPFARGLDPL
jgi:hypothetical protein